MILNIYITRVGWIKYMDIEMSLQHQPSRRCEVRVWTFGESSSSHGLHQLELRKFSGGPWGSVRLPVPAASRQGCATTLVPVSGRAS